MVINACLFLPPCFDMGIGNFIHFYFHQHQRTMIFLEYYCHIKQSLLITFSTEASIEIFSTMHYEFFTNIQYTYIKKFSYDLHH